MRTKNFLKHLILGALLLTTGKVVSQVSTGSNVATGPTDFLGWNNNGANNFPLRVRHDLNQPIEWWTNQVRRMWLTPTLTGLTVNGYTGLDLSGRLGIGHFNSPVNQPLTLLHLDSMGTEVAGYWPWMGTGVLMTKTSDMMYVGMMGGDDDRSDAIISWSDNVEDQPDYGPDRLRFIFTNEPTATPTMTAQDLHGLELARVIPDANGNEGYFGIGDWHTAGMEPDERLDVLDQTIRIRRLPPDYQNDTLTRVVMVDTSGRLHWRHINTWPTTPSGGGGGSDCDWVAYPNSNSLNAAFQTATPGDTIREHSSLCFRNASPSFRKHP